MTMEESVVNLENIGFSYDGARRVLENVNLSIKTDDFIGITGSNGCGKTTLLRLLSGALQPTDGAIKYFNNGKRTPYTSIGYLPQYSAIDKRFPLSVKELVEMGLLSRRNMWNPRLTNEEHHRVAATIERMGLGHVASSHIHRLSGGELQRAMLARAVVSSPRLLLLDEPNTYLDADSEERLFELLHSLNKECAIVLVSHDIESVRKHCKRAYSLKQGLAPLSLKEGA